MKLIVAGGRDFVNTQVMITVLMDLVEKGKIDPNPELVCGMARGADMLAYSLWANHNMKIHTFPADWKTHPRSAGYIRNAEMGNFADVLVAFWDGKSRGTKHMIDIMQRLNKPVYIVRY
ncbi:DNA processing protein [Escherichia phage vB_EcoP_SP5M]|uniref:DNA processing protein n=1 Tax=Escherichia phage vB_EcoP_SP5M TaxID=2750853 RepID=A0A7D5FWQ1_9CAUD|nr:DNA processing protein [Escherichia phage vB_EcoP_SP5M]QLF80712.1 DNA processing protein [Escherichia phage vB_EcoP_SP5M]